MRKLTKTGTQVRINEDKHPSRINPIRWQSSCLDHLGVLQTRRNPSSKVSTHLCWHASSLVSQLRFNYFPRLYHWSGQLSSGAARVLPENQPSDFSSCFPILAAVFCGEFRHGRGLRGGHELPDRNQFSSTINAFHDHVEALLVAPLQLVADDLHGINTLEHQPAKVAAMEQCLSFKSFF